MLGEVHHWTLGAAPAVIQEVPEHEVAVVVVEQQQLVDQVDRQLLWLGRWDEALGVWVECWTLMVEAGVGWGD